MKLPQCHEVASMPSKLPQCHEAAIKRKKSHQLRRANETDGVFSSACLIFVYFQLFAIVVEFSLQLLLHLGIAWVVNEVVMFQWVGF